MKSKCYFCGKKFDQDGYEALATHLMHVRTSCSPECALALGKTGPSPKLNARVRELWDAREAYYNSEPIMSDEVYDALEDTIRNMASTHPCLKKTGVPVSDLGGWTPASHHVPMTSLNKVLTLEKLRDWWPSKVKQFVVTDKLDGAGVELVYRGGKLVQAITRGDGLVGDDILENVKHMKGCVLQFPFAANASVKAEVICTRASFAKHFKGEKNPRNTANGTMRRLKGRAKVKHLTLVAYRLIQDHPLPTRWQELTNLREAGFIVPNPKLVSAVEQVASHYEAYVNGKRDELLWDADGLVVEVNNLKKARRINGHQENDNPKAAVALKFPSEQAETTLKGVQWQIGSTGRVTPVAEFKPVLLAGATCRHATLHNIDYIENLVSACRQGKKLIRKGDRIVVSRRGDVIPQVEVILGGGNGTLKPPTECPSCDGALTRTGKYLTCENEGCIATSIGLLSTWVSKMGIMHVGPSLLWSLFESGLVKEPADLYKLSQEELANSEMEGRKVGELATTVLKQIKASMHPDLATFIGSLGVPLFGRTMGNILCNAGFTTLEKVRAARLKALMEVPGIGSVKAVALYEGLRSKRAVINHLLKVGVKPKKTVKKQKANFTVCMTGFRDKGLTQAIEAAGGSVVGGVSKVLSILVVKDMGSSSTKTKKAKELGIKIMDVSTFKAWLAKH